MLIQKIDDEVSLRLFTKDDADELFHLTMASKRYLKEWLGWLDYTNSVEDTAQFIQTKCEEVAANGGHAQTFAIVYNGEIAGTIGFNEVNRSNNIGIVGYWLGEMFQQKGIMSKAFKALIQYGFEQLQLNRIEVRAAVRNTKSRALPEKFGFTKEGEIRQAEWLYDHYVDHVVYGLLRSEWQGFTS